MRQTVIATNLDRRQFGIGAAATVIGAAFPAVALAQDKPAPAAWEQAVSKVLGDAKPAQGKMTIEMPEIAENGNTVPFTIAVDSPMSDKDYIRAIHVIATANPQPGVATFRFTPLAGKASVSSRLRLARTQDVISIAEVSDGRFLMDKRNVKVTIGGCGG